MPRADYFTLSIEGLRMPSVDHLRTKGPSTFSSTSLSRVYPTTFQPTGPIVGLLTNFSRLVDKALREYDAARAEVIEYLEPHEGLRTSPYVRAIDHMENAASATHRATLNASALQARRVGQSAPKLTERQATRLAYLRNAVEHADEKLNDSPTEEAAPSQNMKPSAFGLPTTPWSLVQTCCLTPNLSPR